MDEFDKAVDTVIKYVDEAFSLADDLREMVETEHDGDRADRLWWLIGKADARIDRRLKRLEEYMNL